MEIEKEQGLCFVMAGKRILEDGRKHWRLVHGAPWSPKWNQRISHAWLEYTVTLPGAGHRQVDIPIVLDVTQPMGMRELPQSLYYSIGNLDDGLVVRYSREEAQRYMLESGNWGPWHGPATLALGRG